MARRGRLAARRDRRAGDGHRRPPTRWPLVVSRLSDAHVQLLGEAADVLPFEIFRPSLTATTAHAARPRRALVTACIPTRRLEHHRRRRRRVPLDTRRAGLHRNLHPQDRWKRPPSPGPTCSPSTTSAARRTWRSRRSSTSSSWWASSTRVRGRPRVPRRATRHHPSPGPIHLAGRRTGVHRGPSRCDERAGAVLAGTMARVAALVDVPSVPDVIPSVHFVEHAGHRRRRPRRTRPVAG